MTNQLTVTQLQEKLDAAKEAQQMLLAAIDLLTDAIQDLPQERSWQAYVTEQLQVLASDNHGLLTNDTNVSDIIGALVQAMDGAKVW